MSNNLPNILLTAGDHPKIIAAAKQILEAKECNLTIIGHTLTIETALAGLDGFCVIEPDNGAALQKLQLDRAKTKPDKPLPIIHGNLVQGAEMLRDGLVDGLVAGGVETTDEVIVTAAKVLNAGENKLITDAMVIEGPERTALYVGVASVEFPDIDQLASLAYESGQFARKHLGLEPVVAMIDYQTGQNAPRPKPQEVAQAAQKAAKMADFPVEGPFQLDAAMNPEIGAIKAPNSSVAGGHANVFVFPDIRSGNSNYKNTIQAPLYFSGQSLVKAYGPFLLGVNKPMNDLSRGSTVEEICGTIKFTAQQCQH